MAAAEQLITTKLDIWSSAIKTKSGVGRGSSKKLELYGIKKLRELILELAVRGLLVRQDPNDEPASEVLKKITSVKAKLIKDGKIRKRKKLADVSEEEKVFGLPDSWEYARLNDLGDWGAGATPSRRSPELYGGDIPWFKSGELVGDYISQSEEQVTELALEKASLRYNRKGDVLIAMYGATIGKASILSIPATTNQAVCVCTPFAGVENIFLLTLLKAYKRRFIGMGAGGAQPNISREKIIATVVALPPTAEQNRIVAKVDELMALCDKLEQQQETSITAHQTLVQTLLDALTTASERDGFTAAWARIADHFDTLFTTEWSTDQLKQTILQLAVMGKLVPQDPNDEPASELLKKIAAEKSKLVKNGKIKKQKALPPIDADERPFDVPAGWAWFRFSSLTHSEYPISYGVLVPGPDEIGGVPFVRIADLDIMNPPELPEKSISVEIDSEYERTRLHGGEILMGVVGSIGKLGVAPISWKGANIARAVCRIKIWDFLSDDYLLILLQSEFMQKSFRGDTRTLAQPTLNIGLIRLSPTPIPPLSEQHRIVAKVDELMALSDTLKTRINTAQTTQLQLADATSGGRHRMMSAVRPVGCELLIKRPLEADTNCGSVFSIGSRAGEQPFDPVWHMVRRAARHQGFGGFVAGCNTL